jgi:hypothetical protein
VPSARFPQFSGYPGAQLAISESCLEVLERQESVAEATAIPRVRPTYWA